MKKIKNTYAINEGDMISHDTIEEGLFFMNMLAHDRDVIFSDDEEISKRRKRDVDTCVRLDNYFATLSAMLDFAQKNERTVSDKILHDAQEDLMYLQNEYYISRRETADTKR